MKINPTNLTIPTQQRRHFFRTLIGMLLTSSVVWPVSSWCHGLVGPVKPALALPSIKFIRHDAKITDLHTALRGKVTAMQFMFTGCSQICSLQGLLFSEIQKKLPQDIKNDVQFLSLSIDSLGDDARTLSTWLHRFEAGPNWLAGVPSTQELIRLQAALQIRNDNNDDHTGQIFLLDQQGLLVWVTEDLPPMEVVLRQLYKIARKPNFS